MNRLEFMQCPLCAGHEKIGADTAELLLEAIQDACCMDNPEHVQTELMNIRNGILNAREPRPAPVDEDPLLA